MASIIASPPIPQSLEPDQVVLLHGASWAGLDHELLLRFSERRPITRAIREYRAALGAQA